MSSSSSLPQPSPSPSPPRLQNNSLSTVCTGIVMQGDAFSLCDMAPGTLVLRSAVGVAHASPLLLQQSGRRCFPRRASGNSRASCRSHACSRVRQAPFNTSDPAEPGYIFISPSLKSGNAWCFTCYQPRFSLLIIVFAGSSSVRLQLWSCDCRPRACSLVPASWPASSAASCGRFERAQCTR